MMSRGVPRERFETAHAGCDRAFANNRDKPDVTGAPHMRATAKFDRPAERVRAFFSIASHGDDPDFVAVFFAEQRTGAGCNRVIDRHQACRDGGVFDHDGIGEVFDLREFAVFN